MRGTAIPKKTPVAWFRDNERHFAFHPRECCQQNRWPPAVRCLQTAPFFSLKAHVATEVPSTIAVSSHIMARVVCSKLREKGRAPAAGIPYTSLVTADSGRSMSGCRCWFARRAWRNGTVRSADHELIPVIRQLFEVSLFVHVF
jgi:hypothetical protein